LNNVNSIITIDQSAPNKISSWLYRKCRLLVIQVLFIFLITCSKRSKFKPCMFAIYVCTIREMKI